MPSFSFELPERTVPQLLPRRQSPATYVVKVELDGSEPAIWRRLELASDLTLDRLHLILQAAMGWMDSHLHQFTMGPGELDLTVAPFVTDNDIEEGEEGTPERDIRIDEVLTTPGDRLYYRYDFGDCWDHTLVLEATPDGTPERPAHLRDGARRCPLENSGGAESWNEIAAWLGGERVDAIDDDWFMERVRWLPMGLRPDAFDLSELDDAVADASVATDELAARIPPHPALAELVAQLPEQGVRLLASLCPDPPESSIEPSVALRPLLALLHLLREPGVELTPTGQMKQAAVKVLLDDLDWRGWVFGNTLHEQHLPPVRHLRAGAQTLGLVRRYRGRLVLSPAGRKVVDDPDALWSHLLGALPVGERPEERVTGALWLLMLRAGERARDTFDLHAPLLLSMAGWWVGRRSPTSDDTFDWALPTMRLLWTVQRDHMGSGTSEGEVAAARAALWRDV